MSEKYTTIKIKAVTRDALAEVGKKKETFDDIIARILREKTEQGNAEGVPCQA